MIANSENCPCRGCVPPKRTSTCHSECPEYIKWHNTRMEEKTKIYEARRADEDYFPPRMRRGQNRRR